MIQVTEQPATVTTLSATDAFVQSSVAFLNAQIAELNQRAERIHNANNSAALIHEVRDTAETSDEQILKYRADFEAAQAEILKWQTAIEQYIVRAGLVSVEPVDVAAETEAWKAQNATVKALRTALENVSKDAVTGLTEVKGIPGSARGGSQAGVLRPRVQRIRVQVAGQDTWTEVFSEKEKDGAKVQFTNMTVLAQALTKQYGQAVTAQDVQAPLFEEAKTTDLSTLNGQPVTFAFNVTNKNDGDKSVNLIVEVTPRAS